MKHVNARGERASVLPGVQAEGPPRATPAVAAPAAPPGPQRRGTHKQPCMWLPGHRRNKSTAQHVCLLCHLAGSGRRGAQAQAGRGLCVTRPHILRWEPRRAQDPLATWRQSIAKPHPAGPLEGSSHGCRHRRSAAQSSGRGEACESRVTFSKPLPSHHSSKCCRAVQRLPS